MLSTLTLTGGQWYWINESWATQAEINLFVHDAGLQYLYCTDEALQVETVWPSPVQCLFLFFFFPFLYILFSKCYLSLWIFPPPMHVLNGSLRTFLSASQASAVRQYSKASCPLMSLFRCSSESFDITTQIDHRACKCYVTAQQPT